MGKVNGSGTCWDKYSGGNGRMNDFFPNSTNGNCEDEEFWEKEIQTRSDYGNISRQEKSRLRGFWNGTDYSEKAFNQWVAMINDALASGGGGSSGDGSGGGSGGGGGSSGGRSAVEKQKDKIRNKKEYQRLDRGEKDRVLREMDNRGKDGKITYREYNDVFNRYVLPFD